MAALRSALYFLIFYPATVFYCRADPPLGLHVVSGIKRLMTTYRVEIPR